MTIDQRLEDTGLQEFQRDWQRWHAQHDDALAAPHGFLAVTGLHFLNTDPTAFPGVPGHWHSDATGVHVRLDDTEVLDLAGGRLPRHHDFGVLPERSGVTVTSGDVEIEVAKRGGFDILRPRDPASPRRTSFAGTPTYPVDPGWVVVGHYTPFAEPQPTTVGAAVEGLEHVYDAVGEVTFSRGGEDHSLVAFPGRTGTELLVLFTDETAGRTTYPAVRSLTFDAPNTGGEVRLDFNRAVNLPCAYTPYATCPLPPSGNHLSIEVAAGELDPALDAAALERVAR